MKRYSITGPESSGKSTLALQLADHFQLPLVLEYARQHFARGFSITSIADIVHLAKKQIEYENIAMLQGVDIICDTDMIVLYIWCEDKFGHVPQALEALIRHHRYDYSFLCMPDIPWQPDPLRVNPNDRPRLFNEYLRVLDRIHAPYSVVEGVGSLRFNPAQQILARLRQ